MKNNLYQFPSRSKLDLSLVSLFLFLGSAFVAIGCSPKVYVMDRQTVLEEEASGNWPELESQFLQSSMSSEPVEYVDGNDSSWRKKVTGVLPQEVQLVSVKSAVSVPKSDSTQDPKAKPIKK